MYMLFRHMAVSERVRDAVDVVNDVSVHSYFLAAFQRGG